MASGIAMETHLNPRRRILNCLEQVLDKGLGREQGLETILAGIPAIQRARWTALFYGCLRSHYYLLPWLEFLRRSKGSSKKLPRKLELLLLMAAHQLRMMDSFPAYAVIQESLKLVPRSHAYLKKYVGFLLREIERSDIKINDNLSLPNWLKDEVPAVLGDDFCDELQKRLMLEPSSACFVPVNPNHSGLNHLGRQIYTFSNLDGLERKKLIELGAVFGESLSLSMPLRFTNEPENYLDLCSAPGSKLSVALLVYPHAKVWAVEKNPLRYASTLERLNQNPRVRSELHRLNFFNLDALDWLEGVEPESMDCIMLDAPCSALGTLLNHPEFLNYKSSQLVENLPALQLELLRKAVPLLKSGGQLIYSVCTFRSMECFDVIEQCRREFDYLNLVSGQSLFGERLVSESLGQYVWGRQKEANQLFYCQKFIRN